MKTITKSELLKNFENQKYVQINFPKVATDGMDWSGKPMMVEIPNETVLHMRSEVQNLDHFNMVYKDGDKYYLEENMEALERVCRRAKVGGCADTWESASYCLYCADYDMKEAVKLLREQY